MCGRFAITLPNDAMAQLFAAAPANLLPEVPNYNVCPTTGIHVIAAPEPGQDDAGTGASAATRRLVRMRWGFLPHWYKTPTDGPLLINARAETIAEKPAFRSACRTRRCLIPASGFYEWTKDADGSRLPWYIRGADDAVLAFAGIWQSWTGPEGPVETCAVVTTGANPDISGIHHRMPVILASEDWGLWLGEAGKGAAPLMRPAPSGTLTAWRVDRAVNSNRAAGPQLIEPI